MPKPNLGETHYVPIIPNISKMLDDDDKLFDYPLSDEMRLTDNRYRPGAEMGRGGMKKIIRAEDKLTSRDVAQAFLIKSDDPARVEAFFKEAKLTAGLQHPNIIPLYDAGYDDHDRAFFIMKPIEGLTLSDHLKELKKTGAKPDYQRLMDIFIKICDAISYAHSRAIIHLDLKPENINLGEYGEVLVGDWGLAKVLNTKEDTVQVYDTEVFNATTLHGTLKGTPGFMAPEQIDSKCGAKDEQTDIYSLGAILYNLLCLRPPNQGDELKDILRNTLTGVKNPPSHFQDDVPLSLEAVTMKALSTQKAGRYSSVVALSEDIKKWQAGFATSAEDHHLIKTLTYLIKRHKQKAFLLALLILSSFIFIGRIISEKQRAETQTKLAITQKNLADEQRLFALEQKNLAELQKREALKQKAQAEHAFQLFKNEQNERATISQKASPRLMHVARNEIEKFHFKAALRDIELAVLWDPDNIPARSYLARFLFYTQRFKASIENFELLPDKAYYRNKIYKIAKKYAQLKNDDKQLLSTDHFIELLLETQDLFAMPLNPTKGVKVSTLITNFAHTQAYSLEDKLRFAETALRFINPLSKNWSLSYTINKNLVDIDLSHQRISDLGPLANLPINKLDLSNTNIKTIEVIFDSSIVELDVCNTTLTGTMLRHVKNLKRLIVSPTQFPHFDMQDVTIIRK